MGASTAEVLVGHRAAGGVKVDGTRVVGAQLTVVAEVALTGAVNAAKVSVPVAVTGVALDLSNMGDGSGDNDLDNVDVTNTGDRSGAIMLNFDKIGDEINANRVDIAAGKVELDLLIAEIGAILVQADKTTADLVTQKVLVDAMIVALEGHGLNASS